MVTLCTVRTVGHCRCVVCACSAGAVGSFSNKPLSPKNYTTYVSSLLQIRKGEQRGVLRALEVRGHLRPRGHAGGEGHELGEARLDAREHVERKVGEDVEDAEVRHLGAERRPRTECGKYTGKESR